MNKLFIVFALLAITAFADQHQNCNRTANKAPEALRQLAKTFMTHDKKAITKSFIALGDLARSIDKACSFPDAPYFVNVSPAPLIPNRTCEQDITLLMGAIKMTKRTDDAVKLMSTIFSHIEQIKDDCDANGAEEEEEENVEASEAGEEEENVETGEEEENVEAAEEEENVEAFAAEEEEENVEAAAAEEEEENVEAAAAAEEEENVEAFAAEEEENVEAAAEEEENVEAAAEEEESGETSTEFFRLGEKRRREIRRNVIGAEVRRHERRNGMRQGLDREINRAERRVADHLRH